MVLRLVILFLCSAGEEDVEWQISQSPTSVIGHSSGEEGLAQPMLEVMKHLCLLFIFFACVMVAILSMLVFALQLQISDQRFEDAEEMVHDQK